MFRKMWKAIRQVEVFNYFFVVQFKNASIAKFLSSILSFSLCFSSSLILVIHLFIILIVIIIIILVTILTAKSINFSSSFTKSQAGLLYTYVTSVVIYRFHLLSLYSSSVNLAG